MARRRLLERLGLHRRELRAWALYDVANSAFMTTVLMMFPLFFVPVAAKGLAEEVARSRFAFATSLSVLLVGLLGPVLGAVADYRGSKKAFLAAFLALGASATGAMYLISEGEWVFALAVFVIANVGVTSTLAFYNALLPAVASPEEVDRVSAAGFALGYLGGGLLLALNLVVIANPQRFGLAGTAHATRLAFLSVALWWVLFSIPLFRRVREPPRRLEAGEEAGEGALGIAARRLGETFRELRRHKDAVLLLGAFLIYNDAINTIIRMATTFGDEIGIPQAHLMGAILMVQFVGVPFAFAFGLLADRIGPKRAIFVALAVYAVVAVYGFGLRSSRQFFLMAFLVATSQGGAQALSRSLFATMIPKHKAGEMFGFFGVFDRFGGALGSLVFGLVLATTGSSRPAILTLIVFFAVGALLLSRVDVERGRRLAREAEAAAQPVDPTTGGAAGPL
jgi:UMF1 family MFS transporter